MCTEVYPQPKASTTTVTQQVCTATARAFLDTPADWRHRRFIWQWQLPIVVVACVLAYAVDFEEELNHFSTSPVPEFSGDRWNSGVESLLVLQGAWTQAEQPQVLVSQLAADIWRVHQSPEPVTGPLPWTPGCIARLHEISTFDRKKVEHD